MQLNWDHVAGDYRDFNPVGDAARDADLALAARLVMRTRTRRRPARRVREGVGRVARVVKLCEYLGHRV